jgi:hypothetical protein
MGVLSNVYFEYYNNFNDLGDQRYDQRFLLSAGRLFFRKLKLDLSAFYTNSDYDVFFGRTPEGEMALREDDIYGVTGSLRYMLRERWQLLLMLGLVDRNSNLAGFSYDDLLASAGLEFTFPLYRRRSKAE